MVKVRRWHAAMKCFCAKSHIARKFVDEVTTNALGNLASQNTLICMIHLQAKLVSCPICFSCGMLSLHDTTVLCVCYISTYSLIQITLLQSLPHTYCAVQISRVWTPPIPSAHCSHPPLWNQTLVTTVEHL